MIKKVEKYFQALWIADNSPYWLKVMGGEVFVDVIQYGWGILEEFIESLSRSGVVYIFLSLLENQLFNGYVV